MDVENPGDGADGFSVADEVSGEFLLIGLHFLWPAEGHAACLSGQPAFLCSAEDEGALELGDAGETVMIIRPDGLVVSAYGSSSDCSPAFLSVMHSAIRSSSEVERASRSRRVTTNTSSLRSCSSSFSSLGRLRAALD